MARLRRRPRQRPLRRRPSDHQGERREARARLELSLRRDRLQSDRGRRHRSTAADATARSSPLDAKTGQKIWIREGMQAMTARGMNYWESKDGKDRRLIFAMNDYLQADRCRDRSARLLVRQGRRRRSARRTGARSRHHRAHPVRHAGTDLREPDPARIGDGRGLPVAARRSPRLRRDHRQARVAVPHRAASGRVRLRDLAEGRLQVRRRCEHMGRDHPRYRAGHRLLSRRVAHLRLLRRRPARRESVRQLDRRARRANGQAPVALPDGRITTSGTSTATPHRN